MFKVTVSAGQAPSEGLERRLPASCHFGFRIAPVSASVFMWLLCLWFSSPPYSRRTSSRSLTLSGTLSPHKATV